MSFNPATGLVYIPAVEAPGRLFTFVLDGSAKLELVRGIEKPTLTVIAQTATPAEVERGGSACRNLTS
jgi:hypothetical protein